MGMGGLVGQESADTLKYKEAKYVSGENVACRAQRFFSARLQETISIFTMMFLSCQHFSFICVGLYDISKNNK